MNAQISEMAAIEPDYQNLNIMKTNSLVVTQLAMQRKALGFPLNKVAERCGVAEKILRDWEDGGASPPMEVLHHWAAALGFQLALVPVEKKPRHRIKVDWRARRVTVDGVAVRLAPMEWKIIERLAHTPGQPVSQRQLFEHLYGEYRPDGSRSAAIRVLIGRLRRKLPLAIDAQLGRGYLVDGIEPSPRESLADAPAAPGSNAGKAALLSMTAPVAPVAPVATASRMRSPNPPLPPSVLGMNEPAPRPGPCRAEELGVIERFLAEKGATRCPDAATLAQSALSTLIWDKVKRKWVRPPAENGDPGLQR